MKPWMGAVAVAAAIFAVPATALAGPDDPALIKFQLESSAKYDDFEALGFEMDHAVEQGENGSVIVSAWVTDQDVQIARAAGFENVGVVHDKFNIDGIRAEMAESVAAEEAAKDALADAAAGKSTQSAAPKSIRAQRADFYENNVGRWLSIEANVDGASYTGNGAGTYVGPTVMAEWFDAAGNKMGQGVIAAHPDPDVSPDYYQYHGSAFRIGNKGDGKPDPALVRIASSNGDVDTIAGKEWISKNPPGPAAGFQSGFTTRYLNGQEAHQRMRTLATEFPNISEAIKLPEQTRGYQRKAQTMLGYTNATGTGPTETVGYVRFDDGNLPVAGTTPTAAQGPSTVVLTSKEYGHQGGNSLTARILPAAGNDQALSVALVGNAIRVTPATNATGAITSTANQVIAAINAHPDVSQLVTASKYRLTTGDGVVQSGAVSPLNDLLRAPATVRRGPMDQYAIRIGKQRDGTKVGVFFYCQEHGNEIATSGVCLETTERLLRNYGTDPKTTELVDNLDIFIVPQINPDGATHSLYDSNRRKNLSHHCDDTTKFPNNSTDPANRNSWGVDLNRNFSIGTIFDGFQGASATDCLSGNFAGLFEFSEPEARNESWIQTTYRNIKFANNIHSSGNLFMWPPGAYTPQRVALPYPPYGTLNFFDQAARQVLDGIKTYRGTMIHPAQTGPVIDVLYSAAGNSADEAYYKNGIIGYDFEIGSTIYYVDPVTGIERTCSAGQQPPFGDNANDCLDNEGFDEAMEFATGNFGLLQSALDYQRDTAPPVVEATGPAWSNGEVDVRFTSNEASSIYYTTDGSTPTTASTEWKPNRARALPLPITLSANTTLKWIAHDFKGNMSAVGSKTYSFETVAPTVTLTTPADGAVYTQGQPVIVAFSCADEGGSTIASCVGTQANGAALDTATAGMKTFTVTAKDAAGNTTVKTVSFRVLDAVNTPGTIGGSVPATLALNFAGPVTFGAFTPGVAREYTAMTDLTVISTAGDATLSVATPGRMTNGAFSLTQPLQVSLAKTTWTAPTSNEKVVATFKQAIGANEGLRTGSYSTTLTFTLSTTAP
ncbi:M14 family zinc carboxypeptidase [Solirubrobacter taibaiensis]|nr:M14 family zinc carboxypeptidase [Solirubrobacter taibaiensis]